ncbi:MAG: hypothetical protein NTW19_00365 [Planctomycetota bacterium]|nr:hypothetical protein [Planctomycetota bacterium]
MNRWTCALELDTQRRVVAGSAAALSDAIARGADLRIGTAFRHNEHINVESPCNELIREVAEFGVTYRLASGWVAGVMSLRQPIELPEGFGARPSMSFFLYNQDGTQAIARPHLDGLAPTAQPGPSTPIVDAKMPRYHTSDSFDAGTLSPSHNFVYDFETFRYHVRDDWREALSHEADGTVRSGSLDALTDAFWSGAAIKVGVRGLAAAIDGDASGAGDEELFVHTGSHYYYTDRRLFMLGSHPIIRIRPGQPMRYASRGWDFGWLMLRTDGHVVYRRCDPYTLAFTDIPGHYAIRWFVR